MSRTQTLDQALTDGDSAIAPLLEQWLANEQSTRTANPKARPGPYEVRVSFGGMGEGRKPVVEITWSAAQAIPTAVPGLVAMVRDKVIEQWGPSPMGSLRFVVYHATESARAEKNFTAQRQIAPGVDEFGMPGGDLVYLRQQNVQLHNAVIGMAGQMTLALQHTSTLAAEGMKSAATLATARTAGSAAADAGGFWGLASLIAVAVTWPILQDAVGAKGATLPQMLELFRAKVAIAVRGDQRREALDVDLAPGAPTPPDGVAGDAPAASSAQGAQQAADPLEVMRQIAKDREYAARFKAAAENDPELKLALIQAFA